MKSPKSKEDLIEMVVKQIITDVSFKDLEAVEELLSFCPIENLIAYLPEEDWEQFKHLTNG